MPVSSHLLIKNIIINHIFPTLEDVPGDCGLRRLTSQTGGTEKGLKGPARSEDQPRPGHMWAGKGQAWQHGKDSRLGLKWSLCKIYLGPR